MANKAVLCIVNSEAQAIAIVEDLRTAGPLIAAGPIIGSLSGAAVGAATGGIAGALIGYGIPEIEAKRYEGKVQGGNILLSVHTDDSKQVDRVKEIFKRHRAEDIAYTGESKVPRESSTREPYRGSHA